MGSVGALIKSEMNLSDVLQKQILKRENYVLGVDGPPN